MLITPDWPAPPQIHALTSTRMGGASRGVFDSLNLGTHVGDDPDTVARNRHTLRQLCTAPQEPRWLNQTHSTTVVSADTVVSPTDADASWTRQRGIVCAVMTADCLPLLLCDRDGKQVAAVHAGWRGLANGVIENTLDQFTADAPELLVWLGPAIGPTAFEVGEDVLKAFTEWSAESRSAFRPSGDGKWLADLYSLARLRLAARGIEAVYGGDYCTYLDSERFYSYRRDGQTGRMASLIWID